MSFPVSQNIRERPFYVGPAAMPIYSKKNTYRLGIDLSKVDLVVISHIHFDRTHTENLAVKDKQELNVRRVAIAHCTGQLAIKLLQDLYKEDYVYAGPGKTISF